MSCTASLPNTELNKALKESVGNNGTLMTNYISTIMEGEGFLKDFVEGVKTDLGLDVMNIPKNKLKDVVKYIKDYVNNERPTVGHSSKIQNENTGIARFGYTCIEAREEAKRTAAAFALDRYHQILHKQQKSIEKYLKEQADKQGRTISKRELFVNLITSAFRKEITDRLISRGLATKAQLNEIYDNNDTAALEKLFGKNPTIQDQNLLSVYREILANRDEFFDEVFNNKNLGDIRIEKLNELEEDNKYVAQDEQKDDTEGANNSTDDNINSVDDKDEYIKNLTEKLGDFADFMTHIDMGIRAYLGSLKRTHSSNKLAQGYDYNTDNYLGIAENMSVEECSAMLYSSADFTNVREMIRSIYDIANKTPGFGAFRKLADDLIANDDLAFEFYRNFGKFVMSKVETVVDGDSATSRTSNTSADKLTSLKFEYLNAIKSTATLITSENANAIYDDINKQIQALKGIMEKIPGARRRQILEEGAAKRKADIASQLAEQLRRYYPSLEDATISNYLNGAKNKNFIENAIKLNSILKQTIEGANNTYQNYGSRSSQIGHNYYRLQELENLLRIERLLKNPYVTLTETDQELYTKRRFKENQSINGIKELMDAIKEVNEVLEGLYATNYVDESSQSAAFDLANELVKFSTVKVELNSRNVHGNQSSDVINNSMITNIMNTLKNDIALGKYGEYKSKTRQYDFSNIMVEHWDYEKNEDGTYKLDDKGNKIIKGSQPINFGLFRHNEESNTFEPTEYAHQLLRARLFSGATDVINSSNVLYSEMSKGDYIATGFVNFFNVENIVGDNTHGITFANYFMRIPSDAPKNFVIVAPKYSIGETKVGANDGLFRIANPSAVTIEVNRRINNLPIIDNPLANKNIIAEKVVDRNLKQLVNHATGRRLSDVRILSRSFINEETKNQGEEVSVTFNYRNKDNVDNYYVLRGILEERNGKLYLTSPTFEGFTEMAHSADVNEALGKHFRSKMLKNGEIERTVNTDHPIFQQFRNIFIQELTDAATAIDKLFETRNGLVIPDANGMPKFNKGFDNSKNTLRGLYKGYHFNDNTIYKINEDGRAVLTGRVFGSDKFKLTITDENGNVDERNFGKEIIDECISFLYGGATDSYLHATRSDAGVKITFTDKQNEVVNRKLEEFINAYSRQADERMEQYKEFLPEHLITDDNIQEYALNHYLMYNNFDDIFEGDTKFYKSTQDFLKRAKESQGSGVPYGITNYNVDLTGEPQRIRSGLDNVNFIHKKENGTIEKFDIYLRDKFKAITVKNTIKTGDTIGIFEKNAKGDIVLDERGIPKMTKIGSLTKKLIKLVGEDKAKQMMAGYDSATVNDAQSYITFEEWVRRITARGQLPKYKKLIEAVLDETKPLDAATINEFIQVQKNFYYDQYYDERLGVMVPRQIKNAEFVLVKRLVADTELEQVYDLMKEKSIDQLNTEETSKAAKANVLSLWDNEGNLTQENIDDFRANANDRTIENFNYNYLYTQQETPQHMDSENKAGIQIMKKILDNIPEKLEDGSENPLYKTKERFFDLYTANIEESRQDLFDNIGVELDENGNIQLDELGRIKGLDAQVFFNMLQDEVARLGLDSNMMDYVTLVQDGVSNGEGIGLFGITIMPTYMSNVSTKLESIAQSLFNNRITRQTLPGFHAAQVTNIGFKPFSEHVTGVTYDKKLQYHPNGEPYAEIMLPTSAFGLQRYNKNGRRKSDEELLKELKDAGLDTIIGYRIPTEGKQSISIMKVVGFSDDAYGSTIVLPDDWVAQTGADFDIDSVYGINFASYIDKRTNKIKKREYYEEPTVENYYSYLRRRLEQKLPTKVSKEIAAFKKALPDELQQEFKDAFDYEGELYKVLPEKVKNVVNAIQQEEKNKNTGNKQQDYARQNRAVVEGLNNYLNNNELSEENKVKVQDYINIRENLNDYVENFKEMFAERIAEEEEDKKKEKLKEIEKLAKKEGLPTYEEFKEMPASKRNSRDARNNEILQCMLDILSSDASLEENLSRSNFEDIIDARDGKKGKDGKRDPKTAAIDPNVKKRRQQRSPYNIFDQVDYQEDVMSGAKLKAFSVTRDTFCSVCNTVRPYISDKHSVEIVYREQDGYTREQLEQSFENVQELSKGVWVVKHNTIGWSKNNKNSVGKILTAYSSQTTAHILDAVKEGAIPNVNELTFQVYKLFPDLGSDYQTGVSFIMQPGISRIVAAYNKTKSIYSSNNRNHIHEAIKSIAKELSELDGIKIDTRKGINEIIKALQVYNKELGKMFGANSKGFKISLDDAESGKLLISAGRMRDRLKNEGDFKGSSPVEERRKLLFDLGVILQYNKLSHLGNAIGSYCRVTNPDKFGAKQSIFATEDVFTSIKDILQSEETDGKILFTKDVNADGTAKHLLQAIYPGMTSTITVDDFIQASQERSAYPPLNAFLKYATATSIKVNRGLFETQNPDFVQQVKNIQEVFSGNRTKLTEKVYKDYQNYIINALYDKTQAISNVIGWKDGAFDYQGEANTEEERRRIFGYGKQPDLKVPVYDNNGNDTGNVEEFTVKNFNKPTENEIKQFCTLSPAQKVLWLQKRMYDSGVFKHIRTSLFNDKKYRRSKIGAQIIEYVEGNDSIETIYSEFEQAFFNDNPLIALAAMDVVKYAFTVEGFRMRRNGVNKIIKNNVLTTETEDGGTGLVQQMNGYITQIDKCELNMDELRLNFVRSHSGMSQISTFNVTKTGKNQYELSSTGDGIIRLNLNSQFELAEKYGLAFTTNNGKTKVANKFVKLRYGKDINLYKIKYDEVKNEVIAYPLNKLEENERSEWSVNRQNNKFPSHKYYEAVIDEYFQSTKPETTFKQVIEANTELRNQSLYKDQNKLKKSSYATTFDINEKGTFYTAGFNDVISAVTEHFDNQLTNEPLIIRSATLDKFIKNAGIENGSVQTINGKEYVIEKYNFKPLNETYLGKKGIDREIKESNPQIKALIEQARTHGEYGAYIDNAFMIYPNRQLNIEKNSSVNETYPNILMHSSATEAGIQSMITMQQRSITEQDQEADAAIKYLQDKGIQAVTPSVSNNQLDVTRITSEFIEKSTKRILDDLNQFYTDSATGQTYSIVDPESIHVIRTDEKYRQKYLKTILDARAFVKQYQVYNEIDIDSEEPELRHHLTKIKDNINKLGNALVIDKAEKKFVDELLAKLSDNPNVQNDIISLLDGYHSATAFDAYINDMQETPNPLLQIVTKEVMGDIRAAEMKAKKRVAKFRKDVKEIIDRAKANGRPINWKNIIDEYGRIIRPYNNAFVEKLDELRDDMYAKKANYGDASIEYLKAKWEYDKFKLNHTHQKVVDDYYEEKLDLEAWMLGIDGNPNNPGHPEIYSKYIELENKRWQILSHAVNGTLEQSYQDELREVNNQLADLMSDTYYDQTTGMIENKQSIGDPNNRIADPVQRKIYSIEAANALQSFIDFSEENRKRHFGREAKYGFNEQLRHYLTIVNDYELRDPQGNITTPESILMQHPDYVEAKEWLSRNTRFVVDAHVQDEINQAFADLKMAGRGVSKLKQIARTKQIYDEQGVVDGRKLTDDEIKDIREERLRNLNMREEQPTSDKVLISSAPTSTTIFKPEFYAGMRSNGVTSTRWIELVTKINEILRLYYNSATKTLYTSKLTTEELETLIKLYDELEDVKKTENATNGRTVRSYMQRNVDFVMAEDKYQEQLDIVEQNQDNYWKQLWHQLNERTISENGQDVTVPNRMIYGYMIPKGYTPDGTGNNNMVDTKRTKAIRTLQNYTTTTNTKYYYQKYREMQAKPADEFRAWYDANHIYNPFTHAVEPLPCWTRFEVKPVADDGTTIKNGEYVPAFIQTESHVQDGREREDGTFEEDKVNYDFKEGHSTAANYKDNSVYQGKYKDNTDYSNPVNLTPEEQEMKKLFEDIIQANVNTVSSQRFFDKGFMPSKSKKKGVDAKFIGKEALKLIGWINNATGKEAWANQVDYSVDRTPTMPMMSLLKSKDSLKVNYVMPERRDYATEDEYNEAVRKYREEKKAAEEANLQIHKDMIDDNWEDVMADFIMKSAHYNAIQDNKYMLFFAKNMIDKMDVYVKHLGLNDFKETNNSTEDEKKYVTKKDTKLIEQYENWIRRLVYDQWKEPNGAFTRIANAFQSVQSSKFMMLNITGGIANVTVGETNVIAECLAKEYFGKKHYALGKKDWMLGIPSYFRDMYREEASSLPSAIIKFFNVVDFDEINGVVSRAELNEYLERVRNIAFSPQSMGEHFMQNGALFSLLHSHRLVEDLDAPNNGRLRYKYQNEAEYTRDAEENVLRKMLTELGKQGEFDTFKKRELKDENSKKEYAWFRKDLATEYINIYFNNEQKREFYKRVKDKREEAAKEFNNDNAHPTLMSQLELRDGMLDFKDGSILQQMGDDAYKLLGRFKGRAISVNKKIHGVYDKLGAAQIESQWWGGVVMQYHKHLPMGILKRYRRQGYFNEERGTIEKGRYASLKDFLALPLHKAKYAKKFQDETGISDAERDALIGMQNLMKNYIEFFHFFKTNYHTLPERERANIRRAFADICGIISAICFAIGLRCLIDDDDEGILYNLAMYEADRYASESFMYNPWGLYSEGKKLWSSPVAVQGTFSDAFSTLGLIAQAIIQGDEFDPYYSSGLYAGENKFEVLIKRNIPIYHSIQMLERLGRSNKYYKLTDNMLSFIPVADIADFITN